MGHIFFQIAKFGPNKLPMTQSLWVKKKGFFYFLKKKKIDAKFEFLDFSMIYIALRP